MLHLFATDNLDPIARAPKPFTILRWNHVRSAHLSRRFLGGDSWCSKRRRADGERERPLLSLRFLMVGDTSRRLFTLQTRTECSYSGHTAYKLLTRDKRKSRYLRITLAIQGNTSEDSTCHSGSDVEGLWDPLHLYSYGMGSAEVGAHSYKQVA